MKNLKQSEQVTINRSNIEFAPYNPRKESKHVVDELKKNFLRVGYMGGIIWNQRTGHIVGGHKRVQALDMMYEYDGLVAKDYELRVEMVNLDEKTEKEQNIFLNNKRVQGEMDLDLLAKILPDIDVKNTGLDDYDLSLIEAVIPDFNMGSNDDIQNDHTDLKKEYNQRKEEIKQLKKDIKAGVKDHQAATHFTVTFKTYDEKAGFLESIGINGDDIYITGEKFKQRVFEP